MTTLTIMLFIMIGCAAFGLALALQMRLMIGVVLARALRARDEALSVRESRLAVVLAGHGRPADELEGELQDAIRVIYADYPKPLRHLRLARHASRWLPLYILALTVIWRIMAGDI